MKEQCSFCGNATLSAKQTRYIYESERSGMMVVDGVPCMECDFCHEQYFDVSVLKKIEQDFLAISSKKKKPKKSMQIACEEYASI